MRFPIVAPILVSLLLLFLYCSELDIDGYLKDASVKRLLVTRDTTVLTSDTLKRIHPKEYPFLKELASSADSIIRKKTLYLLRQINRSWCFDYFFDALHDPLVSHRRIAAEGILNLQPFDKKDLILNEILLQNKVYTFPEDRCIGNLLQTIGYIGTSADTMALNDMMSVETEARYRTIYRNVLVKLGDTVYVKEIDSLLEKGSALEKRETLLALQFIDRIEWVEKVIPLLGDETTTESATSGSANLSKRVCDYAIATLRIIDTDRKLPVGPLGRFSYSPDDLLKIRRVYGLAD